MSTDSPVPGTLKDRLRKQGYHFVGALAAVKACRWLHESLVNNRLCYKQKFYGIESHRCVQLAPSPLHCTQRCLFCWRMQPSDVGIAWDELRITEVDDPEQIASAAIEEQRRLVSGYKGNPKVSLEKYEEAREPKHVAISLAGEPTLYPRLSELINAFHARGMTTFLVSNGTRPDTLYSLQHEPTQLYITLPAPNEDVYRSVCRPLYRDGWEKILESLELLSSFSCPTVVRLTLAKGLNLCRPEEYSKLICLSEPTYAEPKAYMHVGYSTKRLGVENMPSHAEVVDFSSKLAECTGYNLIDQQPASRVTLLSKLEKPIKLS